MLKDLGMWSVAVFKAALSVNFKASRTFSGNNVIWNIFNYVNTIKSCSWNFLCRANLIQDISICYWPRINTNGMTHFKQFHYSCTVCPLYVKPETRKDSDVAFQMDLHIIYKTVADTGLTWQRLQGHWQNCKPGYNSCYRFFIHSFFPGVNCRSSNITL